MMNSARPRAKAAIAHRLGNRSNAIVGHGTHEGYDHDAHHKAGGKRAFGGCRADADRKAKVADHRRDGQGGEISIDDGWNAREDLEDRLQPGP